MHSYDEFSSSQPHPLLRTSSPIGTLLNHACFYWHVLVSCRVTGVKHNFLPEQQLEVLYWSRENSPTVTPWKKVTAVPQQLLIVKHPAHEVGSHRVKRWDQVYLLMSIGIHGSRTKDQLLGGATRAWGLAVESGKSGARGWSIAIPEKSSWRQGEKHYSKGSGV